MIVPITDDMKSKAKLAEATITSNLKTIKNYTGLESDQRYYYGALGELAFVESLKILGKRAEYYPKFDGNSDSGDVKMFSLADTPIDVDIKTASQSFHRYIMIPRKQFQAHKRDAYIAVRLNGDTAEILGFCYPQDFKTAESYGLSLKISTLCLSFDEVKDIQRVYQNIQDGEVSE